MRPAPSDDTRAHIGVFSSQSQNVDRKPCAVRSLRPYAFNTASKAILLSGRSGIDPFGKTRLPILFFTAFSNTKHRKRVRFQRARPLRDALLVLPPRLMR